MPDLVEIIGRDREQGPLVGEALVQLVVLGGALGELEVCPRPLAGGGVIMGKQLPQGWLRRLVRAYEVGAFDRLGVDEIVARIMQPPEASA